MYVYLYINMFTQEENLVAAYISDPVVNCFSKYANLFLQVVDEVSDVPVGVISLDAVCDDWVSGETIRRVRVEENEEEEGAHNHNDVAEEGAHRELKHYLLLLQQKKYLNFY